MSQDYFVNGYVDIRILIKDMNISASQSSTPNEIADLVKTRISSSMNCEVIGHKLMIEG